jgi:uncharacterized membrane protein YdbT with pleckstrin-like domain
MEKTKLTIPKVWRSEFGLVCAFCFFGIASVFLSNRFPQYTISGPILSLPDFQLYLTLPLFWLMPFFVLLLGIMRIYDVKYVIDSRGLEARIGILRMNQKITRVLYNDIRSAETAQNVFERVLNIGSVEVGTAATSSIEIIFAGVSAPEELQNIIQRERDRALQIGS